MMTEDQIKELRDGIMAQEAPPAADTSELAKCQRQIAYAAKIADKIDAALGLPPVSDAPVSRLETQIVGLLQALASAKRSNAADQAQPPREPKS